MIWWIQRICQARICDNIDRQNRGKINKGIYPPDLAVAGRWLLVAGSWLLVKKEDRG